MWNTASTEGDKYLISVPNVVEGMLTSTVSLAKPGLGLCENRGAIRGSY